METTTELFLESTTILLKQDSSDILNNTLNHVTKSSGPLIYSILMPTFGIIIVVFNLAVVVSSGLILRANYQPRTTYLFLGNVAFADLITGCAILFTNFYPKENRTQGTCELFIGMIVSSSLASVWSVGLIALDRFLYIVHGIKYKIWMYPLRARLLIIGTWILGLIIGFLPAMGWSQPVITGGKSFCWFIILAPAELVVLTTLVGFLPIAIVVVLYSIIFIKAQKKVRQLRKSDKMKKNKQANNPESGEMRLYRGDGQTSSNPNVKTSVNVSKWKAIKEVAFSKVRQLRKSDRMKKNKQTNNPESGALRLYRGGGQTSPNPNVKTSVNVSKWKAIKVVAFTTGSFVCTWMPYFIACNIYVFCSDPEECKGLRFAIASPLAILGFVNSLLNPFIYAWWHNGFREFMKKLFCRRNKSNTQNSISQSVSTKNSSVKNSTASEVSNNKESPSLFVQKSLENIELDSEPKLIKYENRKI